jgi:heme/copper-type cytochrome/quinol oxidase subunit 2
VTEPTPTPYLRRNPAPKQTNGRWVLVGVLVVFIVLVVFVVVLVITIGLHNSGIKTPPGPRPTGTAPISTP